jgi:hypothetical protein
MMLNQPNSSLKNVGLDDLKQSAGDVPFDQFKNRKSTYNESLYTSQLDQSKVTDQLRRKAE